MNILKNPGIQVYYSYALILCLIIFIGMSYQQLSKLTIKTLFQPYCLKLLFKLFNIVYPEVT